MPRSRPPRVISAFGARLYNNNSIDLHEGHCRFDSDEYRQLRRQVQGNHAISGSGSVSSSRTYPSLSEYILTHEPLEFFSNEEDRVKLLVGPDLFSGTTYTIRYVSDLPGADRVLRPSASTSLTRGQERLYKKLTVFLTQVHVGFVGFFICANKLVHVNSDSEESNACVLNGDRPIPVYPDLLPPNLRLTEVVDFRLEGRTPLKSKMYHITDSGRVRVKDLQDRVMYLG